MAHVSARAANLESLFVAEYRIVSLQVEGTVKEARYYKIQRRILWMWFDRRSAEGGGEFGSSRLCWYETFESAEKAILDHRGRHEGIQRIHGGQYIVNGS